MDALIFDFDGLIVDTETPERTVWEEIFHEHGASIPEGYWGTLVGRGAEQEMERPGEVLARISGTYRETYAAIEDRKVRMRERILQEEPRPGILALLKEARLKRLPLAVASSSPHSWVDNHLKRVGLFDQFDFTVCADDVERAKPYPDLYLLACQRLGVAASARVMALEDSTNGIAAAKAAGLTAVAVPNPATAELDFTAADARLETLAGVTLADLDSIIFASSSG